MVLLRTHANLGKEDDKYKLTLLQCIKDCRAHEGGPGYISLNTEEALPEYLIEISESAIIGSVKNSPDSAALSKIVKEGAWNKLKCERRVQVKPLDEAEQYSEGDVGDSEDNSHYGEIDLGSDYLFGIAIFFCVS